ncbi:MAG: hypothetical protein ACI31S_01810 [Bacilli bacterium]
MEKNSIINNAINMNKTKIDLNDNLILKSENVEYNGETLKNYLDKVIESGSNDNGNWIKWADGTMICYLIRDYSVDENFENDGSMFLKDFDGWTFPKPFISTPFVQVTNRSENSTRRTWSYCSGQISNTNVEKIGIMTYWNASLAGGFFYLLAIGKWK